MIEGYCTRQSYQAGDRVELHVSTDAYRFAISVGREGLAREIVLEIKAIDGAEHPLPIDVVENGCGWPAAASFEIPSDWPSGFYRIILTASDGESSEAFFILRAVVPAARILWVIETNTWNAYNFFGGASTYTRDGDTYSNGSARVSFLRPLPKGFLSLPHDHPRLANVPGDTAADAYPAWAAERGMKVWTGAAGWGQWGSSFAAWVEQQGIVVDYACSGDLEAIPDILDGYRMLLCVGHDEYWSWRMRDTVEGFIGRGGNAAFFTGNTSYWQVRLEQDGRQMVAYKADVEQDPVMGTADEARNTGIWSHRLTKRPENHMSGLSFARGGYARVAGATPASAGGFTIYRADHWALADTGLSYGDQLGSAHALVGYECDGCDLQFRHGLPYPTGTDGTPANFEIIAMAPVTLFSRDTAPEGLYPEGVLTDVEVNCLQIEGVLDADAVARFVHGHAVMGTYTSAAQGTVFSGGTTEWAFALGDPQVARIVENVISRLST